jgi:hypothetical protein
MSLGKVFHPRKNTKEHEISEAVAQFVDHLWGEAENSKLLTDLLRVISCSFVDNRSL